MCIFVKLQFSYKVHISTNNMAQNSIMQNLEAVFNCKELLSSKICKAVQM